MIEPTESESKRELDRFAEALISIKTWSPKNTVLPLIIFRLFDASIKVMSKSMLLERPLRFCLVDLEIKSK